MTSAPDIEHLEKVARAALVGSPEGWTAHLGDNDHDYCVDAGVAYLGACPACGVRSSFDKEDAAHIAAFDPPTALALVAEVRELRAKVEGATQQPAIDTLYGEGASSDLWRAALGLERAYAGFCPTGDHYCLQSVGHYCQGDQQFIEELGEEA